MYGDKTEVSSCMEMVLPVRAAFQRAAKEGKNGNRTSLQTRVWRFLIKKNGGIIRKKQWWNRKSCKQECTRWYRQNEQQILRGLHG